MKKRLTINHIEARRGRTQAEIQKTLRETATEERRRRLEADTAALSGLLDDYKEKHPAPNPNASQGHTAGLATDSRLGSARRNPTNRPLQPLPMPDVAALGSKPADPPFSGPAPHRATYRGTRRDARGGSNG